MMTDDDRLEAWLSGDLAADQLPAFQAWLRADATNRRRYLAAVALDQDLRAGLRLPTSFARSPRWRRSPWVVTLLAAAALVFVIGPVAVLWWLESPAVRTIETRLVEGWRLTAPLRSESRDAPKGRSIVVTADDEGWLEGDLGRITLSEGAVVRLDRPEISEPAELGLEEGSIMLQIAERAAPAPFETTAILGTACGDLVFTEGTVCSLTATSMAHPDGSSTPQVVIAIQSGSVRSTVPNPAPLVWSAGSRVRLWRDAEGRLRHEVLNSP